MIDIDELAKLAKAATPGAYVVDIQHGYTEDYVRNYRGDLVAEAKPDDARFIAACSPDTILGLIARIRELEASATRELAEWMLRNSFATGHGDTFHDLLQELGWQIEELRRAAQTSAQYIAACGELMSQTKKPGD